MSWKDRLKETLVSENLSYREFLTAMRAPKGEGRAMLRRKSRGQRILLTRPRRGGTDR